MTEQPSLLDWRPPDPYPAKGQTYDSARDGKRLNAQCLRVLRIFGDCRWHTLRDIASATGDPEASVSARKRDLCRFGFVIEREYVANGLHRYRMLPPDINPNERIEDLGAMYAEAHKLKIAKP